MQTWIKVQISTGFPKKEDTRLLKFESQKLFYPTFINEITNSFELKKLTVFFGKPVGMYVGTNNNKIMQGFNKIPLPRMHLLLRYVFGMILIL